MPLQKAIVPITLAQGVDTRTDPKQLTGKLTALTNGVFTSAKRIQKRNGYVQLSKNFQGGGTVSAATNCATYQNEITLAGTSSFITYAPSSATWSNRGNFSPATFTPQNVVRNTNQQTVPDTAIHASAGLQIFVYLDSATGATNFSVYDTASGTLVVGNQLLSSTALVGGRVLTLGQYFVVVYYDNAGLLRYKAINVSTPDTPSAAVTIANDIATAIPAFDICLNAGVMKIVYRLGATALGFYSLTSALSLSTQTVVPTGDAVNGGICIVPDATNQNWVSYGTASGAPGVVQVLVMNQALTAVVLTVTNVTTTTLSRNISMVVSGTTATIYYAKTTGAFNDVISYNTVTLAGTVSAPTVLMRGVSLASKVFADNGTNYMLVHYAGLEIPTSLSSTQLNSAEPTYFLINGQGLVVAKIAPGQAAAAYAPQGYLPQCASVVAAVYNIPYLQADNLSALNGNVFYQTGVMNAVVNLTPTPAAAPKITLGNNLLLATGQTSMYDGANVVEYGFHLYPENLSARLTTSGGGIGIGTSTTGTNQVRYAGIYEWADNQGQIHRSAPGFVTQKLQSQAPVFATTAAFTNGAATFTISSATGVQTGMYLNSVGAVPNFANEWINKQLSISGTSVTMPTTYAGSTGVGHMVITQNPIQSFYASFVVGSNVVSGIVTSTGGTTASLHVGQVISEFTATPILLSPGTTITAILSSNSVSISTNALGTANTVNTFTADTNSVTVNFPTLRVTAKSQVSLVLYRTTTNQNIFYRISSLTQPTYNDKTVDSVAFVDTSGDGSIIGNEQLYINGGEVDNIAPPSFQAMCSYKNRAVGVPVENPYSFWYSKQVIPGTPVEWSDVFVQNVDATGGALVAVAQMDDKLILFKSDLIFYTAGDGPTPAGTNNDFQEAQVVSTDTGCNNQASVVLTPLGLMYQSPKGIYLLERSLTNQYIGADVQAYNTQTVTSAKLLKNTQQVRFTMSSGVALVYDYLAQTWSVFTNHAAQDATIYGGNYAFVTASGAVMVETPGTYTDNGQFVQLSLTTAWMTLGSIQALLRVWRAEVLGEYKSPHTLEINVAYDYASFTQNVSIPVLAAPTTPYQFRIHLLNQKCETIQLQIQDQQASNFGEGMSLSALSFEAGMKQGLNKVAAAQSFG